MKKHLLTSAIVLAGSSLFAAQYMHVNLPNGRSYDTKIEKADHICHIIGDSINQIKVVRKDSSFALYPVNGAEVTFDDEITRTKGDTSIWDIPSRKKDYVYFLEAENNYQAKSDNAANQVLAKIVEMSEDKDKNFIISPTSLQMALAMLANGASNDETYNKITALLGRPGVQIDSLNKLYKKKIVYMLSEGSDVRKISIANALWLKKGMPFGKNFVQNLADYYKAAVGNVDFMQDSTYEKMDEWVSKTTDSMIQSTGLDTTYENRENRSCVITNTISYQSKWQEPFHETQEDTFITAAKEAKPLNLLVSQENYIGENENYIVTGKNLAESNTYYKMVFILPKEGKTPEEILPTIDWGNLPIIKNKKGNGCAPDTIHHTKLKMPAFSIDDDNQLDGVLKALGLEPCYRVGNLEFITQNAYISTVYQKTHLEADEEGVKGAALTVEDMRTAGGANEDYVLIDHEVILNRPFIIAIKNFTTNELLFLGIINDPTQK